MYYFGILFLAYDPMSSIKNKDADANNPNLYQYVEDNKLDHVYDEIKHKEGYGEHFFEIFNKNTFFFFINVLL